MMFCFPLLSLADDRLDVRIVSVSRCVCHGWFFVESRVCYFQTCESLLCYLCLNENLSVWLPPQPQSVHFLYFYISIFALCFFFFCRGFIIIPYVQHMTSKRERNFYKLHSCKCERHFRDSPRSDDYDWTAFSTFKSQLEHVLSYLLAQTNCSLSSLCISH